MPIYLDTTSGAWSQVIPTSSPLKYTRAHMFTNGLPVSSARFSIDKHRVSKTQEHAGQYTKLMQDVLKQHHPHAIYADLVCSDLNKDIGALISTNGHATVHIGYDAFVDIDEFTIGLTSGDGPRVLGLHCKGQRHEQPIPITRICSWIETSCKTEELTICAINVDLWMLTRAATKSASLRKLTIDSRYITFGEFFNSIFGLLKNAPAHSQLETISITNDRGVYTQLFMSNLPEILHTLDGTTIKTLEYESVDMHKYKVADGEFPAVYIRAYNTKYSARSRLQVILRNGPKLPFHAFVMEPLKCKPNHSADVFLSELMLAFNPVYSGKHIKCIIFHPGRQEVVPSLHIASIDREFGSSADELVVHIDIDHEKDAFKNTVDFMKTMTALSKITFTGTIDTQDTKFNADFAMETTRLGVHTAEFSLVTDNPDNGATIRAIGAISKRLDLLYLNISGSTEKLDEVASRLVDTLRDNKPANVVISTTKLRSLRINPSISPEKPPFVALCEMAHFFPGNSEMADVRSRICLSRIYAMLSITRLYSKCDTNSIMRRLPEEVVCIILSLFLESDRAFMYTKRKRIAAYQNNEQSKK